MQSLHKKFDELQKVYGSQELDSVYGYGSSQPDVMLVFMNPTKRNIATNKSWKGLKAQWLGTKQIWDFLFKCELFDAELNLKIKSMKSKEWTESFSEKVYDEVIKRKLWITNLAKCSQDDARPLPDDVFLKYKELLLEEIRLLKPKKILLFGNQVSSLMLNEEICVSKCRKREFVLDVFGEKCKAYAVFYPVGNGRFNQDKSIEDLKFIVSK